MGKSGSKLKPKNRSQSIVWSFRFPSIGSLSRKSKASLSQPVARPHIDTQRWLSVLDLDQYGDLFRKFDGVEDLLHFNESDIKELGVRNSSHRARLMSSLVALKAKYEKGTRRVDKAQRHSVAVDPRRLVDLNAHADILVASNVTQSKSLCNITMDEPAGDPTALRRLLEWELSLDSQDLRSHAWYHGAIPRHRAEEIVDRHGDFLVRDCASQPGNFVLTCRSNGASLHFVINKVVLQPDTVYERVQYQFEADAYDTVPDLVTYYVGSGKPISAASGARIQTPRNRLYPLSFYAEKYALQSIAGVTAGMSPMTSPLSALPPLTPGSRMSPYSCFRSPVHSPPRSRRAAAYGVPVEVAYATPPRLPSKQRSLSLTPGEVLNGHAKLTLSLADRARPEDHGGSADVVHANGAANGTANGTTPSRFSTHSLPRSNGKLSTCKGTSTMPRHGHGAVHAAHNKMLRVNSDLEGVACSPRDAANAPNAVPATPLSDSPPPKPSRVPPATCSTPAPPGAAAEEDVDGDVADLGDLGDTTPVSESGSSLASAAALQRAAIASYHASGSDSGNGSGDSSAQSSAAGDRQRHAQARRHHLPAVVVLLHDAQGVRRGRVRPRRGGRRPARPTQRAGPGLVPDAAAALAGEQAAGRHRAAGHQDDAAGERVPHPGQPPDQGRPGPDAGHRRAQRPALGPGPGAGHQVRHRAVLPARRPAAQDGPGGEDGVPQAAGGGHHPDVPHGDGARRAAQQVDPGGRGHQDRPGQPVRLLRHHAGPVHAAAAAAGRDVARAAAALHGQRLQLRGQAAAHAQEHERVRQPAGPQHHHPAPAALPAAQRAPGRGHGLRRVLVRGAAVHAQRVHRALGVLHVGLRPGHHVGALGGGAALRRLDAHLPEELGDRAERLQGGRPAAGRVPHRVPPQVPVGLARRLGGRRGAARQVRPGADRHVGEVRAAAAARVAGHAARARRGWGRAQHARPPRAGHRHERVGHPTPRPQDCDNTHAHTSAHTHFKVFTPVHSHMVSCKIFVC